MYVFYFLSWYCCVIFEVFLLIFVGVVVFVVVATESANYILFIYRYLIFAPRNIADPLLLLFYSRSCCAYVVCSRYCSGDNWAFLRLVAKFCRRIDNNFDNESRDNSEKNVIGSIRVANIIVVIERYREAERTYAHTNARRTYSFRISITLFRFGFGVTRADEVKFGNVVRAPNTFAWAVAQPIYSLREVKIWVIFSEVCIFALLVWLVCARARDCAANVRDERLCVFKCVIIINL